MNPYLTAWELYSQHDRGWSWTEALEIHLQRGVVAAGSDSFVMARRVVLDWPDEAHADLGQIADHGNCWHVWAAAGSLRNMRWLCEAHGVEWLTFQRRGRQRCSRVRVAQLFNPRRSLLDVDCGHEVAQSIYTSRTATGTAADFFHGH